MEKKAFVFVVLLLFCIISGYIFIAGPLIEKNRCTEKVDAQIIKVEDKKHTGGTSDGPELVYRCIYAYSYEGIEYEGYEYSEQYNNGWIHKVGENVEILVNKENPTEFMLSPVITHYCKFAFIPIVCLILAVLVLVNRKSSYAEYRMQK